MHGIGRMGLAMAALIALAPVGASRAQDAYVVGETGALTGPAAGTFAPAIASYRIYVDRLNKKGGINGHPIKLVVKDDQGEASKAAANVNQMLSEDKIVLLIEGSLSSTFAPVTAEAKRAGVPVLFGPGVCPNEVFPPKPDPLEFCDSYVMFHYDSRMALTFVKDESKGPTTMAFVPMAVPQARAEMEYARSIAKDFDVKPAGFEVISPAAPDYTPFATRLVAQKPDWGYSYGVWSVQVKIYDAMRRLGWHGRWITYGHPNAEEDLPRINDPEFYVYTADSWFGDNTPMHRDMREALAHGYDYPVTEGTEGWVYGMVLQAVLEKTGWPPTKDKLLAAMNDISIDTKGLRGGPIVWTKDNHVRTRQSYRIYHWDAQKKAPAVVKDWTYFDVK